jgi:CubicO group peptidase (beta-lactamase class C family)
LQVLSRQLRIAAIAVVVAFGLPPQSLNAEQSRVLSLDFSFFERYLESLRQQAGIPGISALIAQDGRIAWEAGLGHADLERNLPARPDTLYPIVDLTQTFASVLILQCAESGTLELNDRFEQFGIAVDATIAQTLAHATSPNGSGFHYDPARFSFLTAPVAQCGKDFAPRRVVHDIFERSNMLESVPGRDLVEGSEANTLFTRSQLQRYESLLSRLAVPYRVDRRGKATRSDDPNRRTNASTGLISTVRDLQRYDAALDNHRLLRDDMLATMWSNLSGSGSVRPTGLGWFVQNYNGTQLIWHFGYAPDAYSSLILKVPAKRLTLILLANSDGLSAPFDLARGDVTTSLFATTFLKLFL